MLGQIERRFDATFLNRVANHPEVAPTVRGWLLGKLDLTEAATDRRNVVLTGEHGVGVEKRDLMPEMFTEIDLDQQQRVKCALDPDLLLNPGKVFPTLHRCAELGRVHVRGGQTRFPDLPRF